MATALVAVGGANTPNGAIVAGGAAVGAVIRTVVGVAVEEAVGRVVGAGGGGVSVLAGGTSGPLCLSDSGEAVAEGSAA